MATLLARLGRVAFRRRRTVTAVWVFVLAAVLAVLAAAGPQFDDAFTIPGSESQEALDRLAELQPAAAGASAQLVFVAPEGETFFAVDPDTGAPAVDPATGLPAPNPELAGAVQQTLAAAQQAPQVVGVVGPFESSAFSPDGRAALATVQYDVQREALAEGSLDALQDAAGTAEQSGLQVEVGGNAFGTTGVHIGPTEFIGVGVAVLVLLLTFGSLLAAGMNLLTALFGVGVGMGGLLIASSFVTLNSTAPTLALMIGLAVGIDYALFILSRHRTQLATGMDPEESAGRATGTAGTAVVFAGLTVIIALSGLSVVGIPFLSVMGVGAAGAVLVAVLVAITLLPALMGFAGARLAPKPGSRAARREAGLAEPGNGGKRAGGERWAALVTRRPLVTVLLVVGGLIALAVPALDLQLALPDNGAAGEGTSERRAYDTISEQFGPGFNGPLVVLLDGLQPAAVQEAAEQVATRIGGTPTPTGEFQGGLDGVVAATGQPIAESAALVTVIPETGPHDSATHGLVTELRDRAPELAAGTGADISVTGYTAVGIDVSDRLGDALLPFLLVVVGLALVLLLLVFRSVLVPVKAALGFLLSVMAALGVVVAVFQWGWLAGLFGVGATGPVISFMPVILVAVLFGLAMDYEVFLVSRMREEYVHGAAPSAAILSGARHVSRVVVAAALIMFSVFASFITIDDVIVKAMALGLAAGILFDAFVVRMTLVPAVLALLGRGAWWLPRWLDRALPDLDVEGAKLPVPAEVAREPEPAGASRG